MKFAFAFGVRPTEMFVDFGATRFSGTGERALFVVSAQRLEQARREINDFVAFKFRQIFEAPFQSELGALAPSETLRTAALSALRGRSPTRKQRPLSPPPRPKLKKTTLAESERAAPRQSTRTISAKDFAESRSKRENGAKAFDESAPFLAERPKRKAIDERDLGKAVTASSLEEFLSMQRAEIAESPRRARGEAANRRRTNSFSSSEGDVLSERERARRLNRRISGQESERDGWERRESLLRQTGLAFSFTKTRTPTPERGRLAPLPNPFLS